MVMILTRCCFKPKWNSSDQFSCQLFLTLQTLVYGIYYATCLHFISGYAYEHHADVHPLSVCCWSCQQQMLSVHERSASALRRVKTYLRTTMCDTRLNNLLVLHVHKDRCNSLVLADCLNQLVCGSEHRLSLFGRF